MNITITNEQRSELENIVIEYEEGTYPDLESAVEKALDTILYITGSTYKE